MIETPLLQGQKKGQRKAPYLIIKEEQCPVSDYLTTSYLEVPLVLPTEVHQVNPSHFC